MEDSGLPPDPYEVLGVQRDAQQPEIRAAHRKLVLKCHPDKVKDPALKAQKQIEFQRVQQAYELLSNDQERSKYDDRVRLAAFKKEAEEAKELRRARKEQQVKRESPESPQKNRKRPGILVVHGRINKRETHAIPDTGAEYNIIAASFAATLGLEVQNHRQGDEKLLRMANGKHIQTRGIVEADWCFSAPTSQDNDINENESSSSGKEKRSWRLVFHVLGDFVYDLVLGHSFLMETETMSRFKERLSRIPRPLSALSVLRVNLMGVPSQRVRGTLGKDKPIWALPDSGSEPNLLSWEYVKRQRWAVTSMNMQDQRLLQFADGSVGRTEGSITVRWAFAPRKGSSKSSQAARESVLIELHVLRDCPYDMILGQDVLEETDAFLEHQDAFEYVESDTAASATNLVIFASLKKKKKTTVRAHGTNPTAAESNNALHDELQRRAEIDRQQRREAMNNQERRQQPQYQGVEEETDFSRFSYRESRARPPSSRRYSTHEGRPNYSAGDSASTYYRYIGTSSGDSQTPRSSAESSTGTTYTTASGGKKSKKSRHASFLEEEMRSEAKFNGGLAPSYARDTIGTKVPVATYT
ncbi:hypothetical protein F5Y04DRAFT_250807 [Hypomontagnella monticulosa]|nr:hypothetical protein F5Y04DRAFT_250807 [Hypomontagnella monticulosa]